MFIVVFYGAKIMDWLQKKCCTAARILLYMQYFSLIFIAVVCSPIIVITLFVYLKNIQVTDALAKIDVILDINMLSYFILDAIMICLFYKEVSRRRHGAAFVGDSEESERVQLN